MTDAGEMLQRIYERTDPSIVGIVDFVHNVSTDVPRLIAAFRTVLDLHRPDYGIPTGCHTCRTGTYPCPTVRAITEALGGSD
jgi:hypothetical protein